MNLFTWNQLFQAVASEFVPLLFCWGDYIEKNDLDRTCNPHGEPRNSYNISVGKPQWR
jgi:hypothetical protein